MRNVCAPKTAQLECSPWSWTTITNGDVVCVQVFSAATTISILIPLNVSLASSFLFPSLAWRSSAISSTAYVEKQRKMWSSMDAQRLRTSRNYLPCSFHRYSYGKGSARRFCNMEFFVAILHPGLLKASSSLSCCYSVTIDRERRAAFSDCENQVVIPSTREQNSVKYPSFI